MNILFVGDVFGQPGREALLGWLPAYREQHAVDFVIVNGENVANGAGITSKLALRLLAGGADVLTTGNHVWRQKEVYAFLATDERIVRPANYPAGAPGRGLTVRPAVDGSEVAVINLAGASIFGRWTRRRKRSILQSRTASTANIVSALAARKNTKRGVLINASAVGYYGFHGDEEIGESAPAGGDSARSRPRGSGRDAVARGQGAG